MKQLPPTKALRLGITLIALACATPTWGDDSSAAQTASTGRLNTYTGIITAVDGSEKIVCVKAAGFTRAFNLAENCVFSLEDKPEANLDALHLGQRVRVTYQNAHGVLVASQIAQTNIVLTGYITAIDPARHSLSVKHGWFSHKFVIGDNCAVVLKDDRSGSLNDLKIGHSVKVIYEEKYGSDVACRIEQKYSTFTGTIRAIDAEMKTVKAKHLMTEMKFNLADGCRIVIGDKSNCSLSDLRIGDEATFSYDDNHGVFVVNRIGIDSPSKSSTGTAPANSPPSQASSPSHQ